MMNTPHVPLIYVGDYSAIGSVAGGTLSAPEWASDSYTTPGDITGKTTFCGYVTPPGSRSGGAFYYGDNLGRIFQEDETGTVPFIGTSLIVPAHSFQGDPGGGRDEGKKLTELWSYLVSEDSAWMLRVWPGGEFAYVPDGTMNQPLSLTPAGYSNYALPGLVDSVAASRSETEAGYDNDILRLIRFQPKSVHGHDTAGRPNSGRGFTLEYILIDPVAAFFLGYGGVYEPGSTGSPVYLVTPIL